MTRSIPRTSRQPRTRPAPTTWLRTTLASAALLVAAAGWAQEETPPPAPDTPPPAATEPVVTEPDDGSDATGPVDTPALPARVIVRVDRRTEISGFVQFEDDDVIVVRTHDGELISNGKTRVLRIIYLVPAGAPRPATIVLHNGQTREGTLIEDGFERVVMDIEGVRTTFRRDLVDHVIAHPSLRDRYEHFKSQLDVTQAHRHLDLCRWLVHEKAYRIATTELQELIERHDLPEARQLLRVVRAQMELRRPRVEDDAPLVEPEPDAPLPGNVISTADVNIIRVFEVDFDDPPKLTIRSDTIDRLIHSYQTSPLLPAEEAGRERLYRADPVDVLQLMFALRAREFYPEVQVITEPHALNLFRQRVHNTWLMNNCATSRCHGGPDAGRLFLHRRDYKDARVRYTNFLILERLELDPEWRLINYESPMDSLIIQYGLPPSLARKPHPPVDGWKPVFRRLTDRMVQDTVRWTEAMLDPRPSYPVEFTPPGMGEPEREPEPDR